MKLKNRLRKITNNFGLLSGVSLLSSPMAYGASSSSGADFGLGLVVIGAGLTIGIATLGVATAQGKAAVSALEGIARNPESKDHIFMPFLLGLVFMEFQALLAFVIAILWTLSNT